MNTIEEIKRLNEIELNNGSVNTSASWHTKYSKCAWVFVGNLASNLCEGDIICIMSQFGEVEDINLVRDQITGKSKRYAFVKYEDARSCVLAVDNFCGSMVLDQSLRVDHVERYRLPKHLQEKKDREKEKSNGENIIENPDDCDIVQNGYNMNEGEDLFAPRKIMTNHMDFTTNIKNQENKDTYSSKRERKQAKAERKEKREEKRAEKRRRELDKENRKRRKKSEK